MAPTTATRGGELRPSRHRDRSEPRFPIEFFLLVLAVVACSILLIDLRGDRSGDPIEAFRDLGRALATGELPGAAAALMTADDVAATEWILALGVQPEFTDCRVTGETPERTPIVCSVSMGGAHFFDALGAAPDTGQVAGAVVGNEPLIERWKPPASWEPIERSFRRWIRDVEPAFEARMFRTRSPFRMTRESGALHRLYLDDFKSYALAPPTTPEAVLQRLAAAVEEVDPANFVHIEPAGFVVDFEGGEHFLEFQLAVGLDPEFSRCTSNSRWDESYVECDVALGERHFYSEVLGHEATTRVLVEIDDDGFRVASWPPTQELFDAGYAFRSWIHANYPDVQDVMFGQSAGLWTFTEMSGNLHMLYLDEYLASLAG